LPESRGDLLRMLESYDRIPNAAETIMAILVAERVTIPEEFKPEFRKLVEINLAAYRLLRKTADALFENPRQTGYIQKEVDVKESESDRLESRMITAIFDSDIEKADKLQLRNVVVYIGNISDRAENAADRMGIIAIKRRI
jgi:predicted phosphate transport protein (TIGR00153 family)